MDLVERDLPDGLRLLVLSPFESELVTLQVVCHVGFAHEPRENLGISHMVEHLCFSDNETRTFPEFRGAIEELGGVFNGYTRDTVTVFTMEVLAEHWREGLSLLRDIALRPRFSPDACAREVKVLQAETGQFRQRWLAWFYEHGWFRNYWVLLQDKRWGPHMHTWRTFHRYSDLTSEKLAAWHSRYYRNDNMAVIAVGRVDPREVEEQVGELFGNRCMDAQERMQHPEPTASDRDTRVATRLGMPFWNQSLVAVGAWNCGAIDGQKALCDVVQELLRHRAFDSLRVEHSLAYRTACHFDGRWNSGSLLLTANVKRGVEDQAEELLGSVLSESLEHDISDSELHGIRNKLLAGHARMNANPGWYAHELAQGAFGEYAVDTQGYPAQLRDVTPADIRRALARLATERGRIVVRQVPLLSVAATVCVVVAAVALVITSVAWALLR